MSEVGARKKRIGHLKRIRRKKRIGKLIPVRDYRVLYSTKKSRWSG